MPEAQIALNMLILTRVLNEAVERGDVSVKLDNEGVARFSATEEKITSRQSEPH